MSKFYQAFFPLFFFLLAEASRLPAQVGCPGCEVNIPDTIAADTLYLSEAPVGQVGLFYQADLSFRAPKTTNPVADNDPSVPRGLSIQKITVIALRNLPPGIDWEPSQTSFEPAENSDGCLRLCGQPLAPGHYEVEVEVTAQVFIFSRTTSFIFDVFIEPNLSETDAFTLVNPSGCGSTEVAFINKIPSEGREGFSYFWDFGNGFNTTDENPVNQLYTQPGLYEVSYEAIIDTAGYFLANIRVDKVTCSDLFNNPPDLYVEVYDPQGNRIHRSEVRQDVRPPQNFGMNIRIGPGNYVARVMDQDDWILGGDKVCGSFNFSQTTAGALVDRGAQVTLTILHPVDTIRARDTVLVFEQPAAPLLHGLPVDPLCVGDTLALLSSYAANNRWHRDSLAIPGGEDGELLAHEPGRYWVEYTSPDGCRAVSLEVELEFHTPPPTPLFHVERNLLSLGAEIQLAFNHQLQWYLDGEPLAADGEESYCASESGTYSLFMTDLITGCVSMYEARVQYDPAFAGCASSVGYFDAIAATLTLFPNPASDWAFLSLELPAAQRMRFIIHNSLGQLLDEIWVDFPAGHQQQAFELSRYASGAYWITAVANSARFSLPLRIVR
jgi:hypothetical protein